MTQSELTEIPRYIRISKVAKILDVDRSTIDRWIRAGKISAIQVGGLKRISVSELDKFIKSHTKCILKQNQENPVSSSVANGISSAGM